MTLLTTPRDLADDQHIVPEELPVRTAVELRPVRPEPDTERREDISHLLEVQPDVHCRFYGSVLVAVDKDPDNLPFGKPGFAEMVEVLHAGCPVEENLEPCRHAVPVDRGGDNDRL